MMRPEQTLDAVRRLLSTAGHIARLAEPSPTATPEDEQDRRAEVLGLAEIARQALAEIGGAA